MPIDQDLAVTRVGDVEIAYTTSGASANPPVLLVAGLGAQLISWDEGLCELLVDRGLFVIRFDNRDAGLSSHLDGSESGVYGLSDLAADAAGLIDHLGIGSAHVVGVSMGGMIAQLLAIEHPERVRSLTSIMSTTGDPEVGPATDEAIALLMAPAPTSRAGLLDSAVLSNRVIGSPGYPVAEEVVRARAERALDRAHDPAGFARQLHACLTTPDRTEGLRRLDVPALVIHGAADPLIGVSGGRATATAVPGAELLVLDGMGHDLPEALWPLIVDRIAALVERAESGTGNG